MAHGETARIGGELNTTFDEQVEDAVTVDLPASLASQAELDDHAADASTHGVVVVAGQADIDTHASDTSTHGAATVAGLADVNDHAAEDLGTNVHGFKGIKKRLADGIAEAAGIDEVKLLSVSGGAEADAFKLAIGALKSALITLPVGGFAALTAAAVDAAMAGGDLGYVDADCVVTGEAGGPFTLTFGAAQAGTNIGNMTISDATGAAAGAVTDDGTGGSAQGVAAVVSITVADLAVGDSLADVVVNTTKASIASQVVRAAADFQVGAGAVLVVANYVDNTNNQYLFEFVDLT